MRRRPRYSSSFNGISVLDLPKDRLLLNRGFYPTYSLKLKPIIKHKPQQHVADNKQDVSKETTVVIAALQKMLRQQTKIDPQKQAEFGIAHPIR